MNLKKQAAFFCAGGCGYVGMELAYRGRSHISMFAAGGLCFVLLGKLDAAPVPGPAKPVLGAMTVTAVELATGLLVNRDHRVWDYRDQPGHFLGQICPGFSLLWIPVSAAAMGLYRLMDRTCPEP